MSKLLKLYFIILAHIGFSQSFSWISTKGSDDAKGNAIVVDLAGNSYITGYYTGLTYINKTNHLDGRNATQSVFVIKYNPLGNIVWSAVSGGNSSGDESVGYGIAVDPNGNVYITGTYSNVLAGFGQPTKSLFITKYNASGTPAWTVTENSALTGRGITVDNVGNIYITGDGSSSVIIAKYSPSGQKLWAKYLNSTSSGNAKGSGLSLGTDGSVYVTGRLNLGSNFLAKFSSTDGLNFWTKSVVTTNTYAVANGVTTDQTNNLYVVGEDAPNAFIAKYDQNGNLLSKVYEIPNPYALSVAGNGVSVDNSGNVYVVGSKGTTFFTSKYDNSLNLIWTKAGNSSGGGSSGFGIDVSNCGEVYITGHINTGAGSPATFENKSIMAYSNMNNYYLAKISYETPIITKLPQNLTFCAGGSGTLSFFTRYPNEYTSLIWEKLVNGVWVTVGQGNYNPVTETTSGVYQYRVKLVWPCGGILYSNIGTVTVNPNPNVSLSTINNVCITESAFTLSGGSPVGGVYFVDGVQTSIFNPLALGIGNHIVTYQYSTNGCSSSASQTITVGNPSINTSLVSGLLSCNSSFNVSYTISCPFLSGNIFKVQLSKPDGTFDPSPYTLGTLASINAGTISATLPSALLTGNYKIRVVGTNPSVIGIETSISTVPQGATLTCPIEAGNISSIISYSNTANNSTANGYQNNFGQLSDDIYYKFTITSSSTLSISTCNSNFDTYVYLLNGTGGVIASNDDNGPLCSGLKGSISSQLSAGTYYAMVEGYNTNSGNIFTTISINGSMRISRDEESNNNDIISIYPNPASNEMMIDAGNLNVDKVDIIDNQGDVFTINNISSEKYIDLSSFNAGLYIVKIYSEKETFIKKMTVIK